MQHKMERLNGEPPRVNFGKCRSIRCANIIFFLFSLCLVLKCFAQINSTALEVFNSDVANQSLSEINTQIVAHPYNVQNLENAISDLTKLQTQASKCINNTQQELNTVNTQLQQISSEVKLLKTALPESTFLQDKRNKLIEQLSDCRLFILKSQDAINLYNAHLQKVATRKLFAAEPHIFDKFLEGAALLKILPEKLDIQLLIDQSGIKFIQPFLLTSLVFFVLLASFFAIWVKKYLSKFTVLKKPAGQFSYKLFLALIAVLRRYAVLLSILIILNIFATLLLLITMSFNYISLVIYAISLYFLVYIFIFRLFLNPPYDVLAPNNLHRDVSKSLVRRLNLLAILVLLGTIIYVIFVDQDLQMALIQFVRTIFISLVAICLINVVWFISRIPKIFYERPWLQHLISLSFGVVLFVILIAEWLGYHGIANYLLFGIIFTSLLVLVTWLLQRILITFLNSVSDDRYVWQKHLHAHLGIKKNQVITEVLWLKLIVYILLICGFIVLLLRIWGLSKANFYQLINALTNGFKIATITIVPPHILTAIILFTFLILLTRLLRQKIVHYRALDVAPGAREALAAIVGYIGFALAALISLLVAGVNFAGLAIIAGALSVGIGFGLQNIVNNFVSGIILLIERPIKLGDRIIVGGTEGFVKKISIRSTQLETPQKGDVIVPNSELISGQVINLMYRNLYSRIAIPISVGFDSDPDEVKNILLKIAKENSQVIKNYPANEPKVSFIQIGKDGLDFELSCLIPDVNNSSSIKSDLYFAIEKNFKKANIKFAYPQRDVFLHENKNHE